MNVMIRTMPQLLILRYYCMVLESTIQINTITVVLIISGDSPISKCHGKCNTQ
jgi:hypothetical protein